jgi:hypothetical protein
MIANQRWNLLIFVIASVVLLTTLALRKRLRRPVTALTPAQKQQPMRR